MRTHFSNFTIVAASLLLLVVVLGWYASENFSGHLGRRLIGIGEAVVWPGRVADALLSGNLGGYGRWRSGSVRVLVSWLVWGLPLLVFINERRNDAR